jgi:hypothetical protein
LLFSNDERGDAASACIRRHKFHGGLVLTAATDDQSPVELFVLPPLLQFEGRRSCTARNVYRSRLAVTNGGLSGEARRLLRRGDDLRRAVPDAAGARYRTGLVVTAGRNDRRCGSEYKCSYGGYGNAVSD